MIKKSNPITKFISDKAKEELAKIEEGIALGLYGTEEKLVSAINTAWENISKANLSTGIVVPNYYKGMLPLLKDLENPLITAKEEVIRIYEIIKETLVRHRDLHNTILAEINGLDELIKNVQNNATRYQLYVTDDVDQFLWSSDSFTSTDNINTSITDAYINNGQVTLKVTGFTDLNKNIYSISIDRDASIGVPGNNLCITSWKPSANQELEEEPKVELVSDTDPHSNVEYLVDSQPNTWYEWEYNYIPKIQKVRKIGAALVKDAAGEEVEVPKITNNYGWHRLIQWPGELTWDFGPDGNGVPIVDFNEQKQARLVLTITLAQPIKLSAIQIIPHIIKTYPKVASIMVSRDRQRWETIAKDVYLSSKLNENLRATRAGVPERDYTGTGLWTIPEREIQYIRISLEATGVEEQAYGLGHRFYYRITEKHKSGGWLTKGKTWTEINRLPNPYTGIVSNSVGANNNITLLGTIIGAIAAPAVKGLSVLAGAMIGGPLFSAMFGGTVTSKVTEEGEATDIFQGTRSVIALKSIDLSLREYAEQSQIITRAHEFNVPIKAASILSTEEIPQKWDNKTEWIEFYISPDGYTWQHIVPLNRSIGKEDTAIINSKTIFVKAILKRPADNKSETPILKNIAIKGIPA